MLKYEIIEVVASELSQLGIKQCNMDYIASSLTISKKTIYEHFSSKQNLICECLSFCISRNIEQLMQHDYQNASPLYAIARINSIILNQALNFCPAFHSDIQHNGQLSKLMQSEYIDYINNCYMKYFAQGKQIGLFADNINISHALSFFDQQIHSMYEKRLTNTVAKIDNYSLSILTYLAGICTDNGRDELARIRTEIF